MAIAETTGTVFTILPPPWGTVEVTSVEARTIDWALRDKCIKDKVKGDDPAVIGIIIRESVSKKCTIKESGSWGIIIETPVCDALFVKGDNRQSATVGTGNCYWMAVDGLEEDQKLTLNAVIIPDLGGYSDAFAGCAYVIENGIVYVGIDLALKYDMLELQTLGKSKVERNVVWDGLEIPYGEETVEWVIGDTKLKVRAASIFEFVPAEIIAQYGFTDSQSHD